MSTLKYTIDLTKIYSMSQKKVGLLLFFDNFGKRGPIFIFFSLLISERICGGSRNCNCHLPSNLLPHYLVKCKWSTMQLEASKKVNSIQSD